VCKRVGGKYEAEKIVFYGGQIQVHFIADRFQQDGIFAVNLAFKDLGGFCVGKNRHDADRKRSYQKDCQEQFVKEFLLHRNLLITFLAARNAQLNSLYQTG
jgi:hypothetical protein